MNNWLLSSKWKEICSEDPFYSSTESGVRLRSRVFAMTKNVWSKISIYLHLSSIFICNFLFFYSSFKFVLANGPRGMVMWLLPHSSYFNEFLIACQALIIMLEVSHKCVLWYFLLRFCLCWRWVFQWDRKYFTAQGTCFETHYHNLIADRKRNAAVNLLCCQLLINKIASVS